MMKLCAWTRLRFVSFHPPPKPDCLDNASRLLLPSTNPKVLNERSMARITLFRFPNKLRRRVRRNRMATLLALLALAVLLVVPFYIIYKPPPFVINYFARKWPDVLWQVKTDQKIIGLTIDDAPSQHTADILNVLKENDAHATFFLIGSQMNGREEDTGAIIQSGSELGNHGMHDEASRSLPIDQLESDIFEVRRKIKIAYEYEDKPLVAGYFRPGSGFFSNKMRRLVDKLGYRMVLGSVYPHDAQISSWRTNANHILSMARPGAIIICHDRRSWTVPMLRKVLPELRKRGYRILNLTELLKEVDTDK
ncbi:polysaccharide deacetylase [Colletotrichum paranaense]|nr:polysaccharide deacetylase [Colletotrichum paranaense]KAK1541812.1 polysaccharide deacetylase [Colletotrichum paranaense]